MLIGLLLDGGVGFLLDDVAMIGHGGSVDRCDLYGCLLWSISLSNRL